MNLLEAETETQPVETSPPTEDKSLDELLVDALGSETANRDVLVDLWHRAVDAITAAKETVTTKSERALALENAEPDESDRKVRTAQRMVERLTKAIHKLKAKIDQIDIINYSAEWHERANELASERDALAEELRQLYPEFVTKLADLFHRIDENALDIEHLHGYAPRGENRRLIDSELKARGLESYSAAQPKLRDALRLPDWNQPFQIAYPVSMPLNPYAQLMLAQVKAVENKQAGMFTSDWAEARKLVDEQTRIEMDKQAAKNAADEAVKKRDYERAVVEQDRRARMGIRG